MDTKQIDPCALASHTTGVILCAEGFGPVAEAAEWLLGHPVWTHEYIMPEIQEALKKAIFAQFPTMPKGMPERTDWGSLAADLHESFGMTVEVKRGSRQREADPVTTLQKVMERKS